MRGKTAKVYERDGLKITAFEVAGKANISTRSAHVRLRQWVAGKLSTELLFSSSKQGPRLRKFRRDGKTYTSDEIARVTGLSSQGAHHRLVKWEKGIITHEQLMAPMREKKIRPDYEKKFLYNLGARNDEEREALAMIPGPTEYERLHADIFGV